MTCLNEEKTQNYKDGNKSGQVFRYIRLIVKEGKKKKKWGKPEDALWAVMQKWTKDGGLSASELNWNTEACSFPNSKLT